MIINFKHIDTPIIFKGKLFVLSGYNKVDEINDLAFKDEVKINIYFNEDVKKLVMYVECKEWLRITHIKSLVSQQYGTFEYTQLWGEYINPHTIPKLDDYLNYNKKLKERCL